MLVGEGIRNHGLGRRRVSGFADADKSASEQQEHECGSESAGDRSDAPEQHSVRDDLWLAEAVGKKSEGHAGERKYDEQDGLQRAELRVANAEMLAQERNKRVEDLTVGEVDKIYQSKYSKESAVRIGQASWGGTHVFLASFDAGDLTANGSVPHSTIWWIIYRT